MLDNANTKDKRLPRRRWGFLFLGVIFGVLILTAICVWFYFTPHIAIMSMRSSAENRDAKTFCSYIDFPVLKDNLKAELNAKMLAEMNKDPGLKDNPFSGFASAMGPTIVNNMVDAYISPASIERAFKGDYDPSQGLLSDTRAPAAATQTFNPDFLSEEKGDVTAGYNSLNEFAVSYKPQSGGGSRLIFARRGFWSWKLVNIKLD